MCACVHVYILLDRRGGIIYKPCPLGGVARRLYGVTGCTMDDSRIRALRQCHPNLRKELLVSDLLPALHIYAGGFLTEAESDKIKAKGRNVQQVDELIDVLVKGKENIDFDCFCDVLEKEGQQSWSSRLKEAADLGKRSKLT